MIDYEALILERQEQIEALLDDCEGDCDLCPYGVFSNGIWRCDLCIEEDY